MLADGAVRHFVKMPVTLINCPGISLMSSPLLLEQDQALAIITLNNPGRANVLDVPMALALLEALQSVAANSSVRALLITANGKYFCAGGDVNSMQDGKRALPVILEELLKPMHAAIRIVSELSIPVVSAINGPVGGGGIGLALCADLVLAAESMKLRGGYSAIGLTPDVGGSWFITQRAGSARARQIFLTNQPMTAEECLGWGIVDAVHPDLALNEAARQLAHQLANGPSLAQARIKTLLQQAPLNTLEQHLDLEASFMLASGESADGHEGINAFIEKRSAKFL